MCDIDIVQQWCAEHENLWAGLSGDGNFLSWVHEGFEGGSREKQFLI